MKKTEIRRWLWCDIVIQTQKLRIAKVRRVAVRRRGKLASSYKRPGVEGECAESKDVGSRQGKAKGGDEIELKRQAMRKIHLFMVHSN